MALGISRGEWRKVGLVGFGLGVVLLYLAVEEWVKPRLSVFGMFFWGAILVLGVAYFFNINKVRM